MSFRKCVFWLGVVLVATVLAGCGDAKEKSMKFFNKGDALYEKGDYVKARLEFKNALQIEPKFARAYYMLAKVELREKNYRGAYGLASKAIDLDPDLWEARLFVAELLIMAKKIDDAREKVAAVLPKDPENARALLVNSLLLIQEKKAEEAEKTLRDMIAKGQEKVRACIVLAGLMKGQGRLKETEEITKQCLDGDEKNPALLFTLARVHMAAEDLSAAEEVYRQLIEYYPDRKSYLVALARFYSATKQPEKGEKISRSLVKDEPDRADYRALLARSYEEQEKPDLAIEVIKNAVAVLPEELRLGLLLAEIYERNDQADLSLETYKNLAENNPLKPEAFTARNRMAQIYFRQKKGDLAMSQLEIVLKDNPKDIDAHSLRGAIFLVEGKGLEAVTEFRTVVQEDPFDPKGYYQLARAHLLSGERHLAIDNLKKALSINPHQREALDLIVNLYLGEKAYDDGIAFLEGILGKAPKDLFAISRLGDFYWLKGDVKRAERAWRLLVEQEPENPEGFIKMSLVHAKKKDYPAAEAALDKALALQPDNLNILKRVVVLQMVLKKPDRALKKCLEQIKKVPPAEPEIRMLMGGIYSSQKQYSQAEDQIRKVLKHKPESIAPYAAMAELYYRQGKIEKGIEELRLALKRKPDNVGIKMTIASFYRAKEDYDTALNWHERIADEHPKFIPGLNGLAYMYADRYPTQENLDRALRLLAEIPEELRTPNLHDTLGWVYYKKKDYDSAIKAFNRAESTDDRPVIQLHLGLAFLKKNQIIEARDALEKALADETTGLSDEDKKTAEEALRSVKQSMISRLN